MLKTTRITQKQKTCLLIPCSEDWGVNVYKHKIRDYPHSTLTNVPLVLDCL